MPSAWRILIHATTYLFCNLFLRACAFTILRALHLALSSPAFPFVPAIPTGSLHGFPGCGHVLRVLLSDALVTGALKKLGALGQRGAVLRRLRLPRIAGVANAAVRRVWVWVCSGMVPYMRLLDTTGGDIKLRGTRAYPAWFRMPSLPTRSDVRFPASTFTGNHSMRLCWMTTLYRLRNLPPPLTLLLLDTADYPGTIFSSRLPYLS